MLEGCGMLRRPERTKSLSEQAETVEFQIGNVCPLRVPPSPSFFAISWLAGNFVFIYATQLLAGKILSPKVLGVPGVLSSGIATASPVRRMTGTEEPAQGQMSPETAVRLWISGYSAVTIGSMLPQPNAGVQRSSNPQKTRVSG
jgi:hypothetical protein